MTHTFAIRPAWSPLMIAIMVVGFIIAWPLGLAVLAYILWGDRFDHMFQDIRAQFRASQDRQHGAHTGNVAFDEYRSAELKRLEEERRRLDAMRAEFDEFLRNLRRAKDQEEFDQFMARRHNQTGHHDRPE